jgi:hypothetical protein
MQGIICTQITENVRHVVSLCSETMTLAKLQPSTKLSTQNANLFYSECINRPLAPWVHTFGTQTNDSVQVFPFF